MPTFIVRALGRLGDPVNFSVVTRGLARVSDEPIDPLRATSIGPVLVTPRETPQIKTRCIDVECPGLDAVGGRFSKRCSTSCWDRPRIAWSRCEGHLAGSHRYTS